MNIENIKLLLCISYYGRKEGRTPTSNEDAEPLEFKHIAARNAESCSHFENQLPVYLMVSHILLVQPRIPTVGNLLKWNENAYSYKNV